MSDQRKGEGMPGLVAGRVEELRRLEACERALAESFYTYALTAAGGARLLHLGERHKGIAALLAKRLGELGGRPDVDPDDLWIIGSPRKLETLLFAEETALRTYRDHLVDLDLETRALVQERILPDHARTLELLIGEREPPAATIGEP